MSQQQDEPLLGMATTRELLNEIRVRGEVEHRYQDEGNALAIGAARLLDELPGSMLNYRTIDGEKPSTRADRAERYGG